MLFLRSVLTGPPPQSPTLPPPTPALPTSSPDHGFLFFAVKEFMLFFTVQCLWCIAFSLGYKVSSTMVGLPLAPPPQHLSLFSDVSQDT